MNAHDQIEVRLLGPTVIRRRGGEVVEAKEWRTTKSLELVRLLAMSDGRAVTTDVLLERLWPTAPEKKAQASLRTATYHARLALGEDAIERVADGLVLRNAWVDVQAYALLVDEVELARRANQHLAVAALSRDAEALYLGDLEVESSGEWLLEHRERIRGQRLEVLLAAAESAVALGRMAEALALIASVAQLERTSERAVRVAMRAYGALGEIDKAAGAYDELRAHLAEHLGVDPTPQTRALHVQLLIGTGGESSRLSSDTLVGRKHVVSELAEELTHSCRPPSGAAGGVVWLVGEQGSGRAAVLRAACARAGLRLRRTRLHAADLGSERMPRRLLRAGDVLVTPEAAMLSEDDAVRIRDWAATHRVALVVPVSEWNLFPSQFSPLSRTSSVHIGPLERPEVTSLVELLAQGTPSSTLVDIVLARTGGLPGVVTSVVREWLQLGSVGWTPDGLTLLDADESVPLFPAPGLKVLRLAGTHDIRAVQALAMVAVAGGSVMVSDVDAALTQLHLDHPGDARQLLTELADRGVLRLTADGYQMRSSRDRAEVAAWLRPAERRQLLGAMAREHQRNVGGTSVTPLASRRQPALLASA